MAIVTDTAQIGQPNRLARSLPPYWERVQPISFKLTHADGRMVGEVRVFDDLAVSGEIHTQFSTGRGKGTKVTTFHCESVDAFREIIEVLSLAEKQLHP
jgi:hypothetical protein